MRNRGFEPKVSIVIPAWNSAGYIEECVRSCAAQTYRNCETIVVDNGSSDRTGEIARDSAGDSAFRLVRLEQNAGFAGGMNAGLKVATGKYIVVLNSDAELDEAYVENAVNAFSQ